MEKLVAIKSISKTMPDSETKFRPDDRRELSDDAKEAIRLFQAANAETDEDRKAELAMQFAKKLMSLVDPTGVSLLEDADPKIKALRPIFGKDEYFVVGSGSSGRRIRFRNYNPDNEDEVSEDGENRWMHYRKPSDEDWASSHKFWEAYMQTFGSESVDMLQEIK